MLASSASWAAQREADRHEVEEMRSANEQLKALVVVLKLQNRVLTPALAGGARGKKLAG
jgi:hypothetical protein